MNRYRFSALGALLAVASASASGCGADVAARQAQQSQDAEFAALQARGAQAMGVDQYTSTHLFDALPDGGRIELQRDVDDPAGVEQIRHHLSRVAQAFESGDFSTPAFVHMQEVPGSAVMAAMKDRIEYVYNELPRGAELRFVTRDPEALQAIQQFMDFQRQEHHAGGADHGQHGPDHMPHGPGHMPGAGDHGPGHVPPGTSPHGPTHGGHTRPGQTP